MMTFKNGKLNKVLVPMSLVNAISKINEYKGKQALYIEQSPQILETLKHVAVIQSTEASNSIEGITIKPHRLQQIMNDKARPENRSESEIAGYREVLETIHTSYDSIPITPSVIRQLHRNLYSFSAGEGGNWKNADNIIQETISDGTKIIRFNPVSAFETPAAMQQLCESFNQEMLRQQIEPIILTGAFILDFLCIHPFNDGNGRMARLLTILILYKLGYEVGRFISLEKIIEKSKESYYETLHSSSVDWHEGMHNLLPWLEYFLGVLLAAYKEFEERVGTLILNKGSKSDMLINAIEHFIGDFSFSDIQKACPNVSRPQIYRVLKELKDSNRIEPIGKGRNAKWHKK